MVMKMLLRKEVRGEIGSMSKLHTAMYLIKNDKRGFIAALSNKIIKTGIFNMLSDEVYLRMIYRIRFGKKLNLVSPKTFNEKLNWLKLNDRKMIYTNMVDKFEAKKIVADTIGEEYVVPTYGIYNDFSEIDFNSLPEQFVMKCTHDSGSVIICKNKEKFDVLSAKNKIEKAMKKNLFYWAREWPYKNVKPRIIIEKYIDALEENLIVYKVFCFHGKPMLLQVIQGDKTSEESIDYFNEKWELLDIKQNYPNSSVHVNKPSILNDILKLSSCFLKERAFLRVDWYIMNDKPLFSEFTFFSDAGIVPFRPPKWDDELGKLMNIEQ